MKQRLLNREETLEKMPLLKALLSNHIGNQYEEFTGFTLENLVLHYKELKDENRLVELFEQELATNTGSTDGGAWI